MYTGIRKTQQTALGEYQNNVQPLYWKDRMQTNSTKTILSLSVAPKDYLSHTFILFAGQTQIAGKQTGNGEVLY